MNEKPVRDIIGYADEEIEISLASTADYRVVGELTWALIYELSPEWVEGHSKAEYADTAHALLSAGDSFWSFIAKYKNSCVAILNLNQCASIYAGGKFGEITEFYIKPEFRSNGIGSKLISSAKEFGVERQWPILEVGAPSRNDWPGTTKFYLSNGFSEIGPRLEAVL